jgi:hypothetical protein
MAEESISSSVRSGEQIEARILGVLSEYDLPSRYVPMILDWVQDAAWVRESAEGHQRSFQANQKSRKREQRFSVLARITGAGRASIAQPETTSAAQTRTRNMLPPQQETYRYYWRPFSRAVASLQHGNAASRGSSIEKRHDEQK